VAYALRIINRNRWGINSEDYPGKERRDVPAVTLLDLAVKNNELSVWVVDAQRENLQRLMGTLSANRTSLDVIDYVLFGLDIFEQLEIYTQNTEGDTLDTYANRWHLALLHLTATQVSDLAVRIWYSSTTEIKRYTSSQVTEFIIQSIRDNYFALDQLNPGLQETIKKKMK